MKFPRKLLNPVPESVAGDTDRSSVGADTLEDIDTVVNETLSLAGDEPCDEPCDSEENRGYDPYNTGRFETDKA